MIFISIYLNHSQSTSPPCIPFQYISILSSSSDPLICPPFHSHETPWLGTSSFHKPASPLWHFGFPRGRLKESDEKKKTQQIAVPLSDPGFVLSGLVSIVSDKIIQCTVSTTLFESYESYEYFRIFHTFCTCFILPAKFIPLV